MTLPSTLVVVCGAHLSGQPLNPALLALGAVFAGAGRTAASYRMYALPGAPARPGLVRQVDGGASIEVELYRVPVAHLGALLVTIRPPLGLGHLLLDDGSEPLGFVCEGYAAENGLDITGFGNWRDYVTVAGAE